MTFVDGSVLTAAQLNTHLRDNLMETMAAKATVASQYFVTNGKNRVIARKAVKNTVLAQETTDATDYTDLSTVGPSVTVQTGTSVAMFIGCQIKLSATQTGYASVRIGSANTADDGSVQSNSNNDSTSVEPSDSYAVVLNGGNTDELCGTFHMSFLDTLTPGLNTFTMTYRISGGTAATFFRRRLSVQPLD